MLKELNDGDDVALLEVEWLLGLVNDERLAQYFIRVRDIDNLLYRAGFGAMPRSDEKPTFEVDVRW